MSISVFTEKAICINPFPWRSETGRYVFVTLYTYRHVGFSGGSVKVAKRNVTAVRSFAQFTLQLL
jgi:hypothetical protein